MTSFYTTEELKSIGFKSIGENVLISKKTSIYSPEKIEIGSHVRIDDFCILSGEIILHSYIHIAAYCGLFGQAGIEMENFTGLSPRCTLFSVSDDFSGEFLISPMTLSAHNHLIKGKIIVRKYSQIGTDCVLLPSVTIGEGCAIGAKSLVKESTEEWGIYVGLPAKRIKNRSKDLLKYIKDYNLEKL